MADDLYISLSWLSPPPPDFRAQVKALAQHIAPGMAAMSLASHALTPNQLHQLGRAIAMLDADGADLKPLSPFHLGIAASGTMDLLIPQLIASAARHGVLLSCTLAPYGQLASAALDPDSAINRAECNAVLIALDPREFAQWPRAGEPPSDPVRALDLIETMRHHFRAHGAAAIVQNLASPPETLFGQLDRRIEGTPRRVIDTINAGIVDQLAGSDDHLLDVAAMAETVGLGQWYSPGEWYLAKLPFASACAPFYADHVGRVLGALCGKARRCLILDLDNTLWGGIIGDDGIENILIGQGDAVGEAHLEVQRLALALHDRGVVLAVSSKNEDSIARTAFQSHPDMLLRESHIAVFQANWSDKATNIRAIADTLSLGLASMAFLDDNPAERALVRQRLPEVAVPELPSDPALYARTLAAAGYFEATTFSSEDRGRSAFYKANARRAELERQAGGLDDYLASLDMEISFAPFDAMGRERIAQLISKSNQFNLTTRRYSATDIASMERDFDGTTLQVRLKDIFGDNGMISVVIARAVDRDNWDIDTWLMSCRVLGRGVEKMVLAELSRLAEQSGVGWLTGRYVPTDRNALVADHYAKLGFELVETGPDGATRWRRQVAAPITLPPIRIAGR